MVGTMGGVPRPHSFDDNEGTEMKIIDPRRTVEFATHANFDIQTSVDTTIDFPIHEASSKLDKIKVSINNPDGTGASLFTSPYNGLKCMTSGQSSKVGSGVCSIMELSMPNITMGEYC